jgi:hypothetical protein
MYMYIYTGPFNDCSKKIYRNPEPSRPVLPRSRVIIRIKEFRE